MKALRFYHGMVMCAKFKVGDRISYSDYNCTILYVGEISVWPGEIAYGVEWDDDTRGKHNGKLGGIQYFNTIRPKSGSFLKVSKVDVSADPRRSFYDGICEKYGNTASDQFNVNIGTKMVEQLGFDKLNLINKRWNSLGIIDLSSAKIFCAGDNPSTEPITTKDLDLSGNLITDFKEIAKILNNFKSVACLDLSENRFLRFLFDKTIKFCTVKTLKIRSCYLSMNNLQDILAVFPNVQNLDISGNRLYGNDLANIHLILPNLKSLTVSNNCITNIDLSKLIYLTELDISSTDIKIQLSDIKSNSITFLNMTHIRLDSWTLVDKINIMFPSLCEIRCSLNWLPPIDAQFPDSKLFILIAILRHINIINGTIIDRRMRKDADYYLECKLKEGALKLEGFTLRMTELVKKFYNTIETVENHSWLNTNIITISLIIYFDELMHSKMKIYDKYSIRYLKGLISDEFNMKYYQIDIKYESTPGVLIPMSREFSPLSDYGVANGGKIHVNLM